MWTYGVNNNRQILICNPKANDTQTCLTWNSYPYVANNSTWHTSIFDMKQLSMCGKQQQMTYNHVWHETVIHMWQTTANDTQTFLSWNSCPYVANNSKWHTSMFWHETVIHMWQTTANDIQSCLTWNSYPYVANNSKWHTSIFDMKQLSICGKQQQMTHKHDMKQLSICGKQQQMTYNHFDMKQLSICGKQQQMTHKHFWHETVVHMWQTTANDTQTCLTWNSYPYVANNSKWHTSIFDMKQLSICGKQQQMTHKHVWHETVIHMWQTTANDTQAFLTWNSYPYVANNSKWHTIMFDMKQLSICGKQQQMTHKHVWHETVIHLWQTTANDTEAFLTWNSCPYVPTANDTQACLTWNSYPYVANNSKWHTSMFDMKQLSICGKQQQMTYNHFWHETVVHMWQTTANDIQSFSTWNSYHRWQTTANEHKHLWHETVVHMWQTTANDTQTCLPWNSYPSVANNSKWHRSIFDMKQLSICSKQQQMTHKHVWHETVIHMWQTTANDTRAFLTWNSYPYVANNSKWHTIIFDMKQLSMFYLFIYLKFILPFWLAKQ